MQPPLAASQPTTILLPAHLLFPRPRHLLQHQMAPGAVRGSLQAPNTPRDSTDLFGCTIQWNNFRSFILPFTTATTFFLHVIARSAMVVQCMVVQWVVTQYNFLGSSKAFYPSIHPTSTLLPAYTPSPDFPLRGHIHFPFKFPPLSATCRCHPPLSRNPICTHVHHHTTQLQSKIGKHPLSDTP